MIKPTKMQEAFFNFKPNENTIKIASIRTPEKYPNVFNLECVVSVDEAPNDRDITFLTIGFVNNKRELYIIQTFDDTTESGKSMIKAITEMKKEHEE